MQDAQPDREPSDEPGEGTDPDHPGGALRHPFREARETIEAAASEAELRTGRREATEEEVRASIIRRVVRAFAGFVVIGIGIVLLPLPGPGWLVIVAGLAMLPFAWAERTIRAIRRRIPGIPEEGRIPLSTWLIMLAMVALFTTIAVLVGERIGDWVADVWEGMWS